MIRKVSIIIPTYHRPQYLARAIDSCLQQTFDNIEVLVIDDNNPYSEERELTSKVISRYMGDPRIRYIQHIRNMNGAVARNTGLLAADGEYISFLDDDDEFAIDKIALQVKYLEENTEFQACYCLSSRCLNKHVYSKTDFRKKGCFIRDVLMLLHECNSSSLIFTKNSLLDIEGFDEDFKRHQDVEILIRFMSRYKIGCLEEYLLFLHHEDSQNHLPLKEFIEMKNVFLDKFSDQIRDRRDKDFILSFHHFYIFVYALREKKYIKALEYFPNILFFPFFIIFCRNKICKVIYRKLGIK